MRHLHLSLGNKLKYDPKLYQYLSKLFVLSGILLVRVKELSFRSKGLEFGCLIFQQFVETGIKILILISKMVQVFLQVTPALGVILCPAVRLQQEGALLWLYYYYLAIMNLFLFLSAARNFDALSVLPSEAASLHEGIHKRVFMTYLRMSTHKESKV